MGELCWDTTGNPGDRRESLRRSFRCMPWCLTQASLVIAAPDTLLSGQLLWCTANLAIQISEMSAVASERCSTASIDRLSDICVSHIFEIGVLWDCSYSLSLLMMPHADAMQRSEGVRRYQSLHLVCKRCGGI